MSIYRCPKCGSDAVRISGRCWFEVSDDGAEAVGDYEWDDNDAASCQYAGCGYAGTVQEFGVEEDE